MDFLDAKQPVPSAEYKCYVCSQFQWPSNARKTRALDALHEAAAAGCPHCDIVVQVIGLIRKDEENERLNGSKGSMIENRAEGKDNIQISYDEPWNCFRIAQRSAQHRTMELFELPGAKLPFLPSDATNNVSGNTSEEYALLQTQEWLQECISKHRYCSSYSPSARQWPPMPKRLIDVTQLDDSGSVRLVEPSEERAPYICLSHCWGSFVPSITTRKNLQDRLRLIEWPSLPQTFQDAIRFVRLLGQRLLWIDSLCIIQDDDRDWEEQSIQMAAIFKNSYLTLAASKARNSKDGLYNEVNEYKETILTTTKTCGRKVSILCRKAVPHLYQTKHPQDSRTQILEYPVLLKRYFPLLIRAWVLQERLLSPRIVHFGPAELLWECNERFVCECHNGLDSYAPESYPKVQHSLSLRNASHVARSVIWRNIVRSYTRLQITKFSDRLPGLQGIATELFQDKAPSKVISGLWEGTLIEDLLWESRYTYYEATKAQDWTAPSWSWNKMEAPVAYDLDYRDITEHATISDISNRGELLDDRTIIQGLSITMNVLMVSGKIVYEDFNQRYRVNFLFNQSLQLTPQSELKTPIGRVTSLTSIWDGFERDGHMKSGTSLHCLLIATTRNLKRWREWGLIVKPVDNGEMRFERVGILIREHLVDYPYEPTDGYVTTLKEMFQDAERVTITLV